MGLINSRLLNYAENTDLWSYILYFLYTFARVVKVRR